MRMPAFSRIAAKLVSRRALATGVAALALGTALPVLSGASPALARGDRPAAQVVAAASPANPAQGNGFRTGFFMMGTKPLTITPGGAPLEIDLESGKDSGAPYRDVRPQLVLDSANSPLSIGRSDVVLELRTAAGWQPVAMHLTSPYVLLSDLSGIKGSPMVNGHAVHFSYRLALKAGAAQHPTKLRVRVLTVAQDGTASQGQVRDLTVLPAAAPADHR
ncbi:hypothetical protein [Kitasatospora kifunensis]|uniref:Uncharacterized protein n=1 Tax=Kitasatospora kifunensis TaxID=58351 RepID=A0A7W7R447_KITKI|nr:hypothetical protein [Kitasatospora kifunensis]MBB4924521.1 hypothetical protein [Kitasatospora kifunensis]